jgi:ribosomal protein S18 acetylase RimI-like enzyme
MSEPPVQPDDQIQVRIAGTDDHVDVRRLFDEGVIEGRVPLNDTGADVDNLDEGYFGDDGESCFWVATRAGRVVGMIGVQKTGDNKAEIRRLRVGSTARRTGVGSNLMEEAMRFCQKRGYLKVVLDVQTVRLPAISLFEKFGFKAGPTREVNDRRVQDFYLDLYREPEA